METKEYKMLLFKDLFAISLIDCIFGTKRSFAFNQTIKREVYKRIKFDHNFTLFNMISDFLFVNKEPREKKSLKQSLSSKNS